MQRWRRKGRAGAGARGAGKAGARRGELELFRGLNLAVSAGEMVADCRGEAAAGKSSLLHLLAALDRPTAGEIGMGRIG